MDGPHEQHRGLSHQPLPHRWQQQQQQQHWEQPSPQHRQSRPQHRHTFAPESFNNLALGPSSTGPSPPGTASSRNEAGPTDVRLEDGQNGGGSIFANVVGGRGAAAGHGRQGFTEQTGTRGHRSNVRVGDIGSHLRPQNGLSLAFLDGADAVHTAPSSPAGTADADADADADAASHRRPPGRGPGPVASHAFTQVAPTAAASASSSGSRFFSNKSSASPLSSPSASVFSNLVQSPLHASKTIGASPVTPASQLTNQQQPHRSQHPAQKQQQAGIRPTSTKNHGALSPADSQEDVQTASPFARPILDQDSFGLPRRSATAAASVWANSRPSLAVKPPSTSSPRAASPASDIWNPSPLVQELKTPSRSNSTSSETGAWPENATSLPFPQASLRERATPLRSKTLGPQRQLEQQGLGASKRSQFVSEPDSLLPESLQAAVAVTLEPEELNRLHDSPPPAGFGLEEALREDEGDLFPETKLERTRQHPLRHRMGLPTHLRSPQRATTLDPERHLPRGSHEPALRSSPSLSGLRNGNEMSTHTSPSFSETTRQVPSTEWPSQLPSNTASQGDPSVGGVRGLSHGVRRETSHLSLRDHGHVQQSFGPGQDSYTVASPQHHPHSASGEQQYPTEEGHFDTTSYHQSRGTFAESAGSASIQGGYNRGGAAMPYGGGFMSPHRLQQMNLINSLSPADAAAILRNQELIYQALTAKPAGYAPSLPPATGSWTDASLPPAASVPRQVTQHHAVQHPFPPPHQARASPNLASQQMLAALGSMNLNENGPRPGHFGGSDGRQNAALNVYNNNPRQSQSTGVASPALPTTPHVSQSIQARPPPSAASARHQGPASGSTRSPLLEEFRSRRAVAGLPMTGRHGMMPAGSMPAGPALPAGTEVSPPNWTLDSIRGHIVEFCMDQHGSRFAQEQLDRATREQIDWVFEEVLPMARTLMQDVFGNYVVQKVFEYGTDTQRLALAKEIRGHVVALSLGTYGCRVIQKALDYLPNSVRLDLAMELRGNVLELVQDQNANHVVQKLLSVIENPDDVNFVPDTFRGRVLTLGAHCYSCRVLQRIFERCGDAQARPLLEELCQNALTLVQSPFGNYGVQYVLELNDTSSTEAIIRQFLGKVCVLSVQKYSSNVIEKCIRVARPPLRQQIVSELLADPAQLEKLLQDRFGNYVVQTALDSAAADQRNALVAAIRSILPTIRNDPYGKRIQTKLQPAALEAGGPQQATQHPQQQHFQHQNQHHQHQTPPSHAQHVSGQRGANWDRGR
ncbi:unnamed protein product [Parajaminaea phylloscopi]